MNCAPRHFAYALVFTVLLFGESQGRTQALPARIPIEVRNNQIFLKVAINGAAPLWFILDSGASSCVIDTATAQRLGIKAEGQAQTSGAGSGTVQTSFAKDVAYGLPGVTLTVPRSYVIDLAGQKTLLGREVGGLLGYDFFERYVVALDFRAGVMTLFDPAAFDGAGRGEAAPFRLVRRTPHIDVRLKIAGRDPVVREVLIDSGSGDAVDETILGEAPKRVVIVSGVGLGQEFRSVAARADWMEIGRFRLSGPAGGAGGVPLIGMETLRRFDVVFDYERSRMFLKPNASFHDPFETDASGLDLRWTDDLKTFVVHEVRQNSPAGDAGLAAGDLILSVGGRPSAEISIDQLQALLNKDGRTVRLLLRHGDATRSVVLRLRKSL